MLFWLYCTSYILLILRCYAHAAPSLTISNLKSGLIDVGTSDWDNLGHAMGIPDEKRKHLIDDGEAFGEKLIDTYINEYPGCSWEHVCSSLRQIGYSKVAQNIYTIFCTSG